MIRRRATPDGLPYRVYERFGVRVYSIGYKMRSGAWAFRYECPASDSKQIAALRRKAVLESATVTEDRPVGGFAGLVDAWFEWQEGLPESSADKRATSTLAENRREAANLKTAWGHFGPGEITKTMGYDYLEACVNARDKDGNLRPRPEKGNKEMALAHLILEYGIRKNVLEENPLAGLRKNRIIRHRRLVTAPEMALAVEMGRKHGGARLIVALALRTAWLCVRRSVEVRGITRHAITEDGILWTDGKNKRKAKILIEWSDELRATIEEAKKIKRNKDAGTIFLFGNMSGQRYTKGGWKAILHDLMTACEGAAAERKLEFRKFSLQDCRPLGVSDKLEQGHQDTQDATLHTDGKMISRVYDRREQKRAKPAA
jgi:integrase